MTQSSKLFQLAKQYIPGGVNSPVRAFTGVGGEPVFISRGHGAYLVDADAKEYIDYVGSWGPMIVGHAHSYVVEKVIETVRQGFSFGAPTELEVSLAKRVCELVPSMEMVRFVSSGTEATMSAIRLARGYTKRNKLVKFIGCYHGHSDTLLAAAGSGIMTLGVPSSAGVLESVVQQTLLADFNDLEAVRALFEKYGEDIAGVIVEPVAGNMNCVMPQPGFLQGLRDLCDRYQSLLIFDEVMTGFRVHLGGAQALFQVKPDMTVLGKVIGGGFPVAAFGGRADIMHCLAPLGPVYQAGTLSGNPVAMSAGLATLELISAPGFYDKLAETTRQLMSGLEERARASKVPFYTTAVGGMFGFFFTELKEIKSEKDVKQSNVELFKRFFHAMLRENIYFAPSAFEAGFVSSAHGDKEIQRTLLAAEKVFDSFDNLVCRT